MVALKLKRIVDLFIGHIRADYTSKTDKSSTWLYEAFYPISTPNFNAYNEIVEILMRGNRDSRKLETRFLFDPSRAAMPTIHIHMPSETPVGGNMVGMGFGNQDTVVDSLFDKRLSKIFSSNYDIIVTSNNQTEAILIYELLKRVFIGGVDTLNEHFQKFNFSGKELLYDSTLMPDIFFRAFSCEIIDEIIVPNLILNRGDINSIIFERDFSIEDDEDVDIIGDDEEQETP